MTEYQAFAIANFRAGFNEALEPWLLPRDAYQQMINAHLYRGVLEKIDGYLPYSNFTNKVVTKFDQNPDGVLKQFTVTLPTIPQTNVITAYATIDVAAGTAETFTYTSDSGTDTLLLTGSAGGNGNVNLTTRVATINCNTAPPAGIYSSVFITWDGVPPESPPNSAIMGIKPYYTSVGGQEILVFNEKRLGKITLMSGIINNFINLNTQVVEIPHDYFISSVIVGDGIAATFTGTFTGAPFIPGTIVLTEYLSTGVLGTITVTDNGQGKLTGVGVNSGSINYFTGAYTITFAAFVPLNNYYDFSGRKYGDLFTGNFSNFFSLTNYQYKAFFTNSVNRIYYYDGTAIHYLNTNLTTKKITYTAGIPNYDIRTCLHVFTYRDRLLLINVNNNAVLQVNMIYWSVVLNPLSFINTNDTNGFRLPAPTSESIRLFGYINTDLVVRFDKSERVFRYTEDGFSPFRWDSTNNIWACDTQYSAINYDTFFSSVGKPAILQSDGVNIKRIDEFIPDFTDPYRLALQTPVPYINQLSIGQCYGERFDDIKEGWLCYNSNPQGEDTVTASDYVLAYNYLDGTYATYKFPFSCLGLGQVINVPTWGTTFTTWEAMADTWDSYQLQKGALADLGGDQFNKVYILNNGNTLGDDSTPVTMSVITKNFNPFIEGGELARLGYIELLVSANATTKLRIQFYINDELTFDPSLNPTGYYQESVITFTPTDGMSSAPQTKVWKRIYSGAVGKSHTIRFYQDPADFASSLDQPIYIHAMVLYMKPAGRIFN